MEDTSSEVRVTRLGRAPIGIGDTAGTFNRPTYTKLSTPDFLDSLSHFKPPGPTPLLQQQQQQQPSLYLSQPLLDDVVMPASATHQHYFSKNCGLAIYRSTAPEEAIERDNYAPKVTHSSTSTACGSETDHHGPASSPFSSTGWVGKNKTLLDYLEHSFSKQSFHHEQLVNKYCKLEDKITRLTENLEKLTLQLTRLPLAFQQPPAPGQHHQHHHRPDSSSRQAASEHSDISLTSLKPTPLPARLVAANNNTLNVASGDKPQLCTVTQVESISDIVYDMRSIGHGGEGRVYRAFMLTDHQPVVVKSYFLDCEQSSRIEYAMMILCDKVKGVKIPLGLYHCGNNYYLIMQDDHMSVPLDVIAEKGILTEEQIQHLFSQMVHILHALQSRFIKHRDVKLDNFLLNTRTGRLAIIDFGWAMYSALDRVCLDEVKRCGEPLMGTFDYLPPESDGAEGTMVSYDKATVYALGCILIELFFGYIGKVKQVIGQRSLKEVIAEKCKAKNKCISRAAVSVMEKCLKANLDERLDLEQLMMHPWILADKKPQCNQTKNLQSITVNGTVKSMSSSSQ